MKIRRRENWKAKYIRRRKRRKRKRTAQMLANEMSAWLSVEGENQPLKKKLGRRALQKLCKIRETMKKLRGQVIWLWNGSRRSWEIENAMKLEEGCPICRRSERNLIQKLSEKVWPRSFREIPIRLSWNLQWNSGGWEAFTWPFLSLPEEAARRRKWRMKSQKTKPKLYVIQWRRIHRCYIGRESMHHAEKPILKRNV